MAKILNKEPAVYIQEQENFLRELRKFHDNKGTPFKHLPSINGQEIDLYLLYWLVTAQGGWERVNNRSGWDGLLECFSLSPRTVNGSLSLKQTYLRYLDSFEKFHFLGEEEEDDGNPYYDEEDSRSRRQKAQKIIATVPLTYNQYQHNVSAPMRSQYGLSTDLYERTDYDRLGLSLLSSLPNEQDFAINVCTLLSNEGRHTLKLGKCPRLLNTLLSHAGVFNHHNLREYVTDVYLSARSYDLEKFWHDVCPDKTIQDLIYDERNFYPKPNTAGEIEEVEDDSKKVDTLKELKETELVKDIVENGLTNGIGSSHSSPNKDKSPLKSSHSSPSKSSHSSPHNKSKESEIIELSPPGKKVNSAGLVDADPTVIEGACGKSRLVLLKRRAETEVTDSDMELFAVGRGNGTKELTGQRVLQVATILRNLSFEEENTKELAKNLTCIRFVLLCVNSSWSNLNQMGFDILSNIASDVQLEEPSEDAVTDLLLSTLSKCIRSTDRFQVISSLDVLNKLCGQQVNEEFIMKMFDLPVYNQLVTYLSLHDIHLLISTLECLYSLSSLGENPCNLIVRSHGAVELLVSLVTVEAQSYGPKACILMRVVETVPGSTAAGTTNTAADKVGVTATPATVTQTTAAPISRPAMVNAQVAPVQSAVPGATLLPRHPLPPTPNRPSPPGLATPAPPRPPGPPGSQQVQLRVSNDEPHRVFCLSWLKATYEPSPGKSIEQNIMYKQYLASMHRMGRKEVISAQHYALCIRTLFGGSTGPNKKTVNDKVESHYTGIQVRAQPLPLKLTPAQAAAAQEASRAANQSNATPAPAAQGTLQAANQGIMLQQQGQIIQQQHQTVQQGKIPFSQGQIIQGQMVQPVIQQQVMKPGQIVQQVVQQGQIVQPGQVLQQVVQQGQVVQQVQQGQIVHQQVVQQGQVIQHGQVSQLQPVHQGQVIQRMVQPGVQPRVQPVVVTNQQLVGRQQNLVLGDEIVENGVSLLDGILPDDPKFGRIEEGDLDPSSIDLMKKVEKMEASALVNGMVPRDLKLIDLTRSNHIDYGKMNGEVEPGHKRPATDLSECSPAKRPALDTAVTNGVIHNGTNNITQVNGGVMRTVLPGGGMIQQVVRNPQGGQVIVSSGGGGHIMTSGGQLITNTSDMISGHNVIVSSGQSQNQVIANGKSFNQTQQAQPGMGENGGQIPQVDGGADEKDEQQHVVMVSQGQMVPGSQGQMVLSSQGGAIMSQGGTIMSQGGQLVSQGGTIMSQGGTIVSQGGTIMSQGGQLVSSRVGGGAVMVNSQGQIVSNSGGQLVSQGHQLVSTGAGQLVSGGQLVQSSGGQIFLKAGQSVVSQPPAGQAMLLTQGSGQQKTIIIMQAQNKQGAQASGAGPGQLVQVSPGGQLVQVQGQPTQQLVQQTQLGGQLVQVQGQQTQQLVQVQGQQLVQVQGQQQPQLVQVGGQQMVQVMPGQQMVQVQGQQTQQVVMGSGGQQLMGVPGQQLVQVGGQQQAVIQASGQQMVQNPVIQQVVISQAGQQQQQRQQQVIQSSGHSGTVMQHAAPSSVIQPNQTIQAMSNGTSQPVQPLVNGNKASPPPSLSPAPTVTSASPSPPPPIKINPATPFVCEWARCLMAFKTPKEVENHAIAEHCPIGSNDIPCLWQRCDGMKRKRFSLMTHLQDRHCHPQLMKLMAVRRVQISQSGKSDVPLPPAPPPHPGYAPNAALHAIKRHAVEFVNPKEIAMRDEKEGPVTKSIRLTSSLILRNLVIYSSIGKSRLRAFESHLSTVALSNVESSRTVSQILFDLNTKSEEVDV